MKICFYFKSKTKPILLTGKTVMKIREDFDSETGSL